MACYRGKKLSEEAVLDVISSVLVNEKLSTYKRLLIAELLYEEFTVMEQD